MAVPAAAPIDTPDPRQPDKTVATVPDSGVASTNLARKDCDRPAQDQETPATSAEAGRRDDDTASVPDVRTADALAPEAPTTDDPTAGVSTAKAPIATIPSAEPLTGAPEDCNPEGSDSAAPPTPVVSDAGSMAPDGSTAEAVEALDADDEPEVAEVPTPVVSDNAASDASAAEDAADEEEGSDVAGAAEGADAVDGEEVDENDDDRESADDVDGELGDNEEDGDVDAKDGAEGSENKEAAEEVEDGDMDGEVNHQGAAEEVDDKDVAEEVGEKDVEELDEKTMSAAVVKKQIAVEVEDNGGAENVDGKESAEAAEGKESAEDVDGKDTAELVEDVELAEEVEDNDVADEAEDQELAEDADEKGMAEEVADKEPAQEVDGKDIVEGPGDEDSAKEWQEHNIAAKLGEREVAEGITDTENTAGTNVLAMAEPLTGTRGDCGTTVLEPNGARIPDGPGLDDTYNSSSGGPALTPAGGVDSGGPGFAPSSDATLGADRMMSDAGIAAAIGPPASAVGVVSGAPSASLASDAPLEPIRFTQQAIEAAGRVARATSGTADTVVKAAARKALEVMAENGQLPEMVIVRLAAQADASAQRKASLGPSGVAQAATGSPDSRTPVLESAPKMFPGPVLTPPSFGTDGHGGVNPSASQMVPVASPLQPPHQQGVQDMGSNRENTLLVFGRSAATVMEPVAAGGIGARTNNYAAVPTQQQVAARVYSWSLGPNGDVETCFRNLRRRIEVELDDGCTVQMCLEVAR